MVPVIEHPVKVATPETAVTGLVPQVRPPEARVMGAVEVVTVLPPTSWTVTLGWVMKALPSTALAEGWVEKVSLDPTPRPSVMLDDVALVRPDEVAPKV